MSVNIAQGAFINAPVHGVDVQTSGSGAITIFNAGTITAGNTGIFARSQLGTINITNAGQIIGQTGIDAAVLGGTGQLTITNSGSITARGGPAIDTRASAVGAQVTNSGTITGYLTLNSGSSFINSQGGVFNATGTSTFVSAVLRPRL